MTILHLLVTALMATTCQSHNDRVCALIDQLHEPSTSSSALGQLRIMTTESPDTAGDVTTELRHRLSDTSDLPTWRSEALLAGSLKLAGTAGVLASSLGTDTRGGGNDISGMSKSMRLEDDQAGQALVQIGDAAVTSVKHELMDGNRLGRFRAAYVLIKMGNPDAETALREHYPVEADPGLKNLIGRHLNVIP